MAKAMKNELSQNIILSNDDSLYYETRQLEQ